MKELDTVVEMCAIPARREGDDGRISRVLTVGTRGWSGVYGGKTVRGCVSKSVKVRTNKGLLRCFPGNGLNQGCAHLTEVELFDRMGITLTGLDSPEGTVTLSIQHQNQPGL